MLLIAKSLKDFSFRELMDVYKSDNLKRASKSYPDLSQQHGLERVYEDFYSYLQECFFNRRGARYYILEEDGHYLSAMRLEPYNDGVLITALETSPAFRRKGFAKSLLLKTLDLVRKEGIGKVYSHIYRSNQASSNLHKKCGFHLAYTYAAFLDGTISSNADTYLLEFED